MIKKVFSLKNFKDYSESGVLWGKIIGYNDLNESIHFTGDTISVEGYNIAKLPILFTSNIDDIGYYSPAYESWVSGFTYKSGDNIYYNGLSYKCIYEHTSSNFDDDLQFYWSETPEDNGTFEDVTFTGSTKINEFRRYSKRDSDTDLYNPIWNTGFTYIISDSNNKLKQITNEFENEIELSNQKLYEYKIWVSGNTNSEIRYKDIGGDLSEITFKSKGLNHNNSNEFNKIKENNLLGVVYEPKIKIDVFIDRGQNSSFDRHIKLSEIKSVQDLENYGNGFFKIKEI